MIGLLNVTSSDALSLTRQEERLIRSLQQAFGPMKGLLSLDMWLQTSHGETALFLRQGEPLPQPELEDLAGPGAFPGNDCFSVSPIPGLKILVRFPPDPALCRLIELVLRETSERMEAERREELLLEEVAANWESLDALHEISTDLFRSGDTKEAMRRLVNRLASFKTGLEAALFLVAEGRLEPLVSTNHALQSVSLAEIGPLRQVLEGKRALVLNRLGALENGWSTEVGWHRATSLASAPLTLRSEVIGCVIVWLEDVTLEFDTPFSRLVETLSHNASLLMECDSLTRTVRENERMAQDVEIASLIQETMLGGEVPQELPGIEFAAFSVPSQRIDGDFFDFFPLKDGSVDVLIGDVMGKGVAAALLGLAVKRCFSRILANEAGASEDGALDPVNIVQRASLKLNAHLVELERFVTLCFARFHLPTRELEFIDCGHASTVVHRRSTGETFLLRGDDLPLGIQLEQQFAQQSFSFRPGDTFLFYSDGVTENQNPDGEFFGEQLLMDSVETWSSLGPRVLIEQIRKEAAAFCGRKTFSDDFTCIAVRVALNQSMPLQVLRAVIPCDLGQLAGAREWLAEAAEAVPHGGLGEEGLARLQLACGEAIDNCIVHGSPHPCARPVHLEAWTYEDSLTIHLRHAGPAFDPFTVPPPSFDGSRDNGFGLFIVSRSADQLEYRREPDGTNVVSISILRKREN